MNAERLVDMANDIAAYFQAEPDRAAAIEGMVLHLQRFWEPRMRQQIVAFARTDDSTLAPLAQQAVSELARRMDETPTPPRPQGGGDAG